jgi:arginase family enzyme
MTHAVICTTIGFKQTLLSRKRNERKLRHKIEQSTQRLKQLKGEVIVIISGHHFLTSPTLRYVGVVKKRPHLQKIRLN